VYINILKEQTMTWFKKKPRKTMQNVRLGLPAILKKLQIHTYPHPTIRSQGVIVEQICWILSTFLLWN